MIRAENITKVYALDSDFSDVFMKALGKGLKRCFSQRKRPEKVVLDNVSFDIKPGEVVGFLGKNGAGKSTLLKILSGITDQTSGRYSLGGRVASLLEVGTGFHPELSGRENIYLNAAILGMTRSEVNRKFDEIVDFSGVEEFLDTPVKRYSSGMYVRLAFSVAAHLEQEILIVDEVLAVGDYLFQEKCLKKMESAAASGRTVLFVSHNFDALRNLCTRGIVLEDGSITYDGLIGDAIKNYMYDSADRLNVVSSQALNSNIFKNLQIVPPDGGFPSTGEPLLIQILIDASQIDNFGRNNPVIIAKIRDQYGSVVIGCRNDFQGCIIPKLSPEGYMFSITIDEMNMVPGLYTIDLEYWCPGKLLEEHLGCLSFEVRWDTRPNEMLGWNASYGNIYTPAKWTYEAINIGI